MSLNRDQSRIFEQAIYWYNNSSEQTFEISGPPGSGKTYLINQIVSALNIPGAAIAPMAYTGAAAINMRNKGMYNAKTCYSWLYNKELIPVYDASGKQVMDPIYNKPVMKTKFIPKQKSDFKDIKLVIADEGGSIPPEMRKDIDATGCKVLVAGDLDQLPPIFGEPGYLNDPAKVHCLNEVVRQSQNNSIILLSRLARDGKPIPHGYYGNVLVIYEDELTDKMIRDSQVIICSYNRTRDAMTHHIRHNILGHRSELPEFGERLVCRKNNWNIDEGSGINLTNGLLGNCVSMPGMIDTKTKTFELNFKPDMSMNTFTNLRCSFPYFNGDSNTRKHIKETTNFNIGELFEFGYSITTHMSQGSEFGNGIYIEEPIANLGNKLNYVGLTRFKNFCIYVKRRPKKYR